MDRQLYLEKTYAGVLGKIIGVYLGRPVEGWTYQEIVQRFGEISTYVNEELGLPLVVTDDDLSGTFTFIRALEDYGLDPNLSPAAVGQTWLNYLVEGKTILWWGGRGTSSEHTAYLNLKRGIEAPASGSAAVNGRTAANQIGAMIFIDGWAMVSPGKPDQAARLARAAASVSHDEDALDAAVFLAVMESLAYIEADIGRLLDGALAHFPPASAIAAQVRALRDLRRREPDWRRARAWIEANHGYDRYPGTCHVLPNFSLILLALLYGDGDFRTSMTIVNTSGWDTDCNAANLGCLLGIRGGLAAFDACPDLRLGPRDLLYLSSADGGRGISDAAREALRLANVGLALEGKPPETPKDGARIAFPFPGALHGFHSLREAGLAHSVRLSNVDGGGGERALAVDFEAPQGPAMVALPVFLPPGMGRVGSYDFQVSPSLYPGQTLAARVSAPDTNQGPVSLRLFASVHGKEDATVRQFGPTAVVAPGTSLDLSWQVEGGTGYPMFETGLECVSGTDGTRRILLHWLDWKGLPELDLERPDRRRQAWKRAWVDGVDAFQTQFAESFRLSQAEGTGLVIQGLREWRDYEVRADVALFGARRAGIAARVQGMRRYYALVACRDGMVQVIRVRDGEEVLAELPFRVGEAEAHDLRLRVTGRRIEAWADGSLVADLVDTGAALEEGAIGLAVTEGSLACRRVSLRPA